MKCREAEGQFAEFLSEKAPKELRRRMKVHLKSCKRCQDRLNRLKKKEAVPAAIQAAGDSPEVPALSLTLSGTPGSHPAPDDPAVLPKSSSPLRFMPVLSVSMTLLIVGGLYFFTQGSAGTETNPFMDQKPLLSDISPAISAEAGADPATLTAESSLKKVGNGKPHDLLLKEAGNGKPDDLSVGAREKAALKAPPLKVLLISRDLKEAIEEIRLQTSQSNGKILEKKEGDLAAKFVLLIPAQKYDAFFESLQQLGLAKETSPKNLPTEGSLKLELTIE